MTKSKMFSMATKAVPLMMILGWLLMGSVCHAEVDVMMEVEMPLDFVAEESMDFNITVTNYGSNVYYQVKGYLDGTLTHITGEGIGYSDWIYATTFSFLLPEGSYTLEIELWAALFPTNDWNMYSVSHIEFTVPTGPEPEPEVEEPMTETESDFCFIGVLGK